MKTTYTKRVYVILKDTNDSVEYDFEDFIYRIASGHIDVNNIDFLTQEGQVMLKEIQTRNGGFRR